MTHVIKCETQHHQLVEVPADKLIQRFSVYGVFIKAGQVLAVKTHSDNWELPGGTPEPGETLEQGLRRELLEEVSIRPTIGRLFYIRESFYFTPSQKAYHSLQFYFMVQSDDTPQFSAEAKEHAFVPIQDIHKDNTNTSSYLALQHTEAGGLTFDHWDPAHQAHPTQ